MAYYVTVINNGRTGTLAGPFRRHGDALRTLPSAIIEADKVTRGESHWFTFGTAHARTNHRKVGKLNGRLGLELDAAGFVA